MPGPKAPVRPLGTILLLGLALGQAGPLAAGLLKVEPVSVELTPRTPTALVTLTNSSEAELRLGLDSLAWSERQDGTMVLDPTEDLVVFPLAVTLKPGASARIRVGLADRKPVVIERSYRLRAEELTSAAADPAAGRGIKFRTELTIPVFVVPSRPEGRALVEGGTCSAGTCRFDVVNPGNAHIRLTRVIVKGVGPEGSTVFARALGAWYVLAGGRRSYQVDVSPAECRESRTFFIEVGTAQGPTPAVVVVPGAADGCAGLPR